MKKKVVLAAMVLAMSLLLASCGGGAASSATVAFAAEQTSSAAPASHQENKPVTLLVAAAASLEYSYRDELIPMFQKEYPWITVEGSYDSSGKLQTQIEEGLEADVFMSASPRQMNALVEQNLVEESTVVDLLENQIVLIVPAAGESEITSFEDIEKAKHLALGDPESVPVGQYAKEALTSLAMWDKVKDTASYGTNVTEVLNWVAEGSADAGIVYATDAATTKNVTVAAIAPEGSLAKKIIYPIGIVAGSTHKIEAELLVKFLQSPAAQQVFEDYGFTPNV